MPEHYETWLELVSEGHFDGQGRYRKPQAYIRQASAKYLECDIFARTRCEDCGHDHFMAFSCKGRGICPSCIARRMAETAARLSAHVFSRLPARPV